MKSTRFNISVHIFLTFLQLPDAVYVIVQPAGQTAAPEMVRSTSRQTKEENHTGTHHDYTSKETKDVQFSRVERFQNRL